MGPREKQIVEHIKENGATSEDELVEKFNLWAERFWLEQIVHTFCQSLVYHKHLVEVKPFVYDLPKKENKEDVNFNQQKLF